MDNFEQKWAQVLDMLTERFGKTPDLQAILFLIGINELGALHSDKFTKEQKQDLMHIAVCKLLSIMGFYVYEGRDEDGWPHYRDTGISPVRGLEQQEQMLKECIILYFQ